MNSKSLRMEGTMDQIIDRYKSTVYGIAFTRTKSKQDADDIFQEVFLAYFRKNPKFNDEEHRKAWIIRATMNCTKKLIYSKPVDTIELTEKITDSLAFTSEEDSYVYSALCELPELYRTVLYLYYFEGYSIEEMGKLMHTRPGTIRMQMTRGRNMIKEKVKGEYYGE